MAIDDLPLPVVNLLNVIGIPWPYIDEQTVWDFAGVVREFRQAVITTHNDATEALDGIANAHTGKNAQALKSGWANLSATHVTEIADGCTVLADALDVAGDYIVAQKGEAIVQLIEMAAEFFADQAAAVVTFGLAEAALPLIELATEKIMESLVQDLVQYIMGEVLEAAAKPLIAKLTAALSGLDWSQSGATAGPSSGFSVDPAAVYAQTAKLRSQAATLHQQAEDLGTKLAGLKF